ncbi:STAS domain-containing protein [Streptomyces sp. B4I13]|uniref:STAS domain-containing protein n=1 Tax=Streptomyces sp. B4I13 TaxID=3042271 RepID=UPI0035946522
MPENDPGHAALDGPARPLLGVWVPLGPADRIAPPSSPAYPTKPGSRVHRPDPRASPIPVVELRGELDISTAPPLAARLDALTAGPHPDLVLDLHSTAFIDCAGLGVLCRARNRVPARHGRLRLVTTVAASGASLRRGLGRHLRAAHQPEHGPGPYPGGRRRVCPHTVKGGQRLASTSSSTVRGARRGLAGPSGPYPKRMSICATAAAVAFAG